MSETFKICNDCKKLLPSTMFYKKKSSADGLQPNCKTCNGVRRKKYQKEHPEKMREYAKKHWHKYRDEKIKGERVRVNNRQKFLDSLKTPCVKCGEKRPYIIQFHHKDPKTKCFPVASGAAYHKSKEDVIKESEKCICLCANCHKEYHYLYGVQPEQPITTLEEYLKRGDDK